MRLPVAAFQWVWHGVSLAGKRVLIRCYHVLGDTIHSFATLRSLGNRLGVLSCRGQPALVALLKQANGIDERLPSSTQRSSQWSLPHVFSSTIATFPAEVPYLRVVPVTLPSDGNLQVGIVWKCSDWAPERSVPDSRRNWRLAQSGGPKDAVANLSRSLARSPRLK